jgi:NADPH:quinone reductase-like Zn-dependent oxidoreductase
MRYYKSSAAERKLVMAEADVPGPRQVRVRVAAASLNYRDPYRLLVRIPQHR